MSKEIQEQPKNYRRRTLGALLCFLPVIVPLASLVTGLLRQQADYFTAIGFVFATAFFTAINVYYCVVRPSLFWHRHGPDAEYRGPSPMPMLGDILAILGSVFGFGAIGTACCTLLLVILNLGGTPWFLFATWRDSSLWDSNQ